MNGATAAEYDAGEALTTSLVLGADRIPHPLQRGCILFDREVAVKSNTNHKAHPLQRVGLLRSV